MVKYVSVLITVLLTVSFLPSVGFIHPAYASTTAVRSDMQDSQASAVQSLIPKIVNSFEKRGLEGLANTWAGSYRGSPILVYANGVPYYYIVPILKNNKCIAEMGIDAKTGEWMWYSETYSYAKFPPVSIEEAETAAHDYIRNKSLGGSLGEPQLTMMPDECLYWVFPVLKEGALLSRACVSFVSAKLVLLEEDIPKTESTSMNGAGGSMGPTDPCSNDTGSAKTSDPTLNVPYYQQPNGYYCGDASLEMVFNYYGPDISQYEIADVARTASSYGSYGDDLRRAAQFSDLSTSVGNDAPTYTCTGYTGRDVGYAAFEYSPGSFWLNSLEALIDGGYPIVVLTWYDTTNQTGHFRVVTGYDSSLSEVIVNDPWNTAWGGAYGGPNVDFSDTTFQNLWSYSSYWGLFTHPWVVSLSVPAPVVQGSTFSVSASVTYPCPTPFSSSQYPASSAEATITLPTGFSLAPSETATKTLGTGTITAGTSASVSWQLVAGSNSGSYEISVAAEGRVSGDVATHGAYSAYSYTDRIGGNGKGSMSIIDNVPPTTTLAMGDPKYTDPSGNVYVTLNTPFTLSAEDNVGGSGVATTGYQVRNATYDSGWIASAPPIEFYLTGLADGGYFIDYNSTDNAGNVEPTNTAKVFVDNTPPTTTLTVGDPKYVSDKTCITPATLCTLEATDTGSDVHSTAYRIYNATYDSGWRTCTAPFCLNPLTDGNYTIEYNSTDNVGNVETTHKFEITLFCWNYVFEDTCGRGTILKINTEHKFFQFIGPDKDYGIKEDPSMQSCGTGITITYSDNEFRLETTSIDTGSDYCQATAWDLTTGKCYSILDQAGIEKSYSVVRGMDNSIYYRAWNGTAWEGWMVLPGATCDSPAAAMLGNQLHVVVRGMDGNTLWYGCLSNPADTCSFSGWTLLSGSTQSAPTLTSNGNMLCLVVRGLDDRIYYRWYSGGCWGSWSAIPTGATCYSPAAALVGNDLHIVVRGMDGNSLWHTNVTFSCGGTPVWTMISGATSSRLVLVGSQGWNTLCLVVTGLDGKVYCRGYTASTDSWAGWTALPTGATCDGPAAAMFLGELNIIVRGMDGNTLWHGYVDISAGSFMGWTLLNGATRSAPTLTG